GAVQEEDQRIFLVAFVVVRHEHDVLVLLAVGVLVDAVHETGRRAGVRAGQSEAQREHAGEGGRAAGKQVHRTLLLGDGPVAGGGHAGHDSRPPAVRLRAAFRKARPVPGGAVRRATPAVGRRRGGRGRRAGKSARRRLIRLTDPSSTLHNTQRRLYTN